MVLEGLGNHRVCIDFGFVGNDVGCIPLRQFLLSVSIPLSLRCHTLRTNMPNLPAFPTRLSRQPSRIVRVLFLPLTTLWSCNQGIRFGGEVDFGTQLFACSSSPSFIISDKSL